MKLIQTCKSDCHQERQQGPAPELQKGLGTLRDRQIAVLGLAFKANTDDVRQSPALRVCQQLLAEGATIRAHDPVANQKAAALLGTERVSYHSSPYEAAQGASALLVLTEWNEFRNLDLNRVKSIMSGDLLVDARNVYDPARARALGFRYTGIGRGNPTEMQQAGKTGEAAEFAKHTR